jgi:hypothetical protein
MAIGAEALFRVTARAKTGILPGFVGMAQSKAGAMKASETGALEGHTPRERGHADAVARRAVTLFVAGRAQVPRRGGAHAVLPHEIALVHHVAARSRGFSGQIHVAAVAVAALPLVFVRVAREALRHGRTKRRLRARARRSVTRHTLPFQRRHMPFVGEAKVLSGEPGRLPRARATVARLAGTLVVGFRVAFTALRVVRQMQRAYVSGLGDVLVARLAIHASHRVRAVLEGVPRLARPNPQDAGARREQERRDHGPHQSEGRPHRLALSKA